ncbi:MAG: hypothetical protein MJY47_08830 [Fibrobacter sp.]|nr:hypothetical protein [Fibrobacter sp.]
MAERLSNHRAESVGITRKTLRLWGLVLSILGVLSRGILQNRVLGVATGTGEDLLRVLDMSGGMSAAAISLALEAVSSCAVPIFAVLLTDGFTKTKSVKNYFLRLLGVAAVSEIPYHLALTATVWGKTRNPLFSLVLALVMLYFYRTYSGLSAKNVLIKVFIFCAAILWSLMLRVDYGVPMLLIVTTLWILWNRPALRYFLAAAVAICCCVGNPLFMFSPFGFLIVGMYKGEEGFSLRPVRYALYPFLLLMVALLGWMMF